MRNKIINVVKKYRTIYFIYYYLCSIFLKIAGFFIKTDKKCILFVCQGGKKYGDNIAPIYEMIKNDKRFHNWSHIWAFQNPDNFKFLESDNTSIIKIDSLKYFISALKAECWITDVSVQRGLNFKKKKTIYFNTWHGVPLKKIGADVKGDTVYKPKKLEKFDYVFAEGTYDAEVSKSAFQVTSEKVIVTGYPRNDKMFNDTEKVKQKVYEKYAVNKDKRIVLYVPTYRDYNRNIIGEYQFELALSPKNITDKLGKDYVLFMRTHGNIDGNIDDHSNSYINVSDYPNVEDLMVASYLIITDYSGIMFDYALLGKPVICYWYDIERYKKERGFYVDMETFIPFLRCYTEEDLIDIIRDIDYDLECNKSIEFSKKCGLIRKGATKNAVDAIARGLGIS